MATLGNHLAPVFQTESSPLESCWLVTKLTRPSPEGEGLSCYVYFRCRSIFPCEHCPCCVLVRCKSEVFAPCVGSKLELIYSGCTVSSSSTSGSSTKNLQRSERQRDEFVRKEGTIGYPKSKDFYIMLLQHVTVYYIYLINQHFHHDRELFRCNLRHHFIIFRHY